MSQCASSSQLQSTMSAVEAAAAGTNWTSKCDTRITKRHGINVLHPLQRLQRSLLSALQGRISESQCARSQLEESVEVLKVLHCFMAASSKLS